MEFRFAKREDIREIVRLLADDALGSKREKYEDPLPEYYYQAFSAMEKQTGNYILLAVDDGQIIGCMQLTMIPGLTRMGMKRAQIEGVRVDKKYRGQQVGQALIQEAITLSKSEGCGLIQLTTDKERKNAHRFYEKLGFISSHEGMKLSLT